MPGRLTPHAELLLAVVASSAHIFAAWRNPATVTCGKEKKRQRKEKENYIVRRHTGSL